MSMKKTIFALTLVAAALSFITSGAYGCGDKFLVVGRGVRYQVAGAHLRPASILIYRNREAGLLSSTQDVDLQSTLKSAGHRFQVVTGPVEMEEALKSGKYDIVLADIADAPGIERALQSATFKPVLLPVIYNPEGTDLSAAKKQYPHVVKSPKKTNQLLVAIDDALNSKPKS